MDRRKLLRAFGVVAVLAAGLGAAPVIAGDRDKGCDKCHPETVTVTTPGETVVVTETTPGDLVTVTDVRTVENTVTETLPAVTVTETLPAETMVETQTETVVKQKIVEKVKWRTKVKWKTRTVIKKVCKRPPPPPRPCCEGSG